jgi:pimeloyl-ACP methyl ester carboxylesterase
VAAAKIARRSAGSASLRAANIDVADIAPKLTVPTLIMCSRREPDNAFEQSRLPAALIPGSRLVPLDSSNHLLPERDPAWKQFLAEIDAFLLDGE